MKPKPWNITPSFEARDILERGRYALENKQENLRVPTLTIALLATPEQARRVVRNPQFYQDTVFAGFYPDEGSTVNLCATVIAATLNKPEVMAELLNKKGAENLYIQIPTTNKQGKTEIRIPSGIAAVRECARLNKTRPNPRVFAQALLYALDQQLLAAASALLHYSLDEPEWAPTPTEVAPHYPLIRDLFEGLGPGSKWAKEHQAWFTQVATCFIQGKAANKTQDLQR